MIPCIIRVVSCTSIICMILTYDTPHYDCYVVCSDSAVWDRVGLVGRVRVCSYMRSSGFCLSQPKLEAFKSVFSFLSL